MAKTKIFISTTENSQLYQGEPINLESIKRHEQWLPQKAFLTINGQTPQAGFSLLEILVVLALSAILITVGINFTTPGQDRMNTEVNRIIGAIRFGADEAVIENKIVRLHFFLEEDPQSYALEVGPSDSFVIPLSYLNQKNREDLTEREEEELEAEIKGQNKDFNKIREFQDENAKMENDIFIIGMGSVLHEDFLSDFETSLYIYPIGERDESFIVLASFDELVTISVPAFTEDFIIKRYPFSDPMEDRFQIMDEGLSQAQQLFEDWKKEL